MHLFLRRLVLPIVAAALEVSPGPLAAQLYTNPLPTRELYRMGRDRANDVNERCVGALSNYLEAVGYMYAYIQAAGRDGSLKSDPAFEQNYRQQFDDVLTRAQRCLKAYPPASTAGMRSDGSESFRAEAPGPGVSLPAQPPAPVEQANQTDAQGRTMAQLQSEIDRLVQERASLLASIDRLVQDRTSLQGELERLRNTPPPSALPVLRTGVEYRIRVKGDGRAWHLDGTGDNLLSTRYQPDDDFTRFIIEETGDGAYRLRNKATGRYLWASNGGSFGISSTTQANDQFIAFVLSQMPDGSWRIASRASGRIVREDGANTLMVSTLYQTDDDFAHFFFVP